MTREEAEAVLAHEVAHIANGDMVTLTLIQGVVNTFVVFLSRVVGYWSIASCAGDRKAAGPGIGYMVTSMVCEVVFGIAGQHRRRLVLAPARIPCRCRRGRLMGSPVPMQNALRRLGSLHTESLPQSMAASGIAGGSKGWMALFSTHPPIEERISALGGR
jgi:heat shock protein HtpX